MVPEVAVTGIACVDRGWPFSRGRRLIPVWVIWLAAFTRSCMSLRLLADPARGSKRMDRHAEQAASDLYATIFRHFRFINPAASVPGIMAGFMLGFCGLTGLPL